MTTATSWCRGDSGSSVSRCYNSRVEKCQLSLINKEQRHRWERGLWGQGCALGGGSASPSPQ